MIRSQINLLLFSSDSMIRSQHADVKDVKKAFIFVFIEAKESYTHMSVSSYLGLN